MIHGALAAAATPLRDGGKRLDEDAFGPVADFLAQGGLDGILALGTTGEGILLTAEERRRAAELYLDACRGGLEVAVHCGAQTTAETVALAEHAAAAGASAVAVIPPPYFPLSEESLFEHFRAAAQACAPVPFFLYEFEARSGYAIPHSVIERLQEAAPNLAGLKVSDTPFERVHPYLIEGLDIFIGSEPLLPRGKARGAAGTVSGLAAAFPEYVVALNRDPNANNTLELVAALRDALQQFQFNAAVKAALAWRGVPVKSDVRAPLLPLTDAERGALEARLEELTAG
jgi:dihydrodipicolinate synthase/N-acetylneuraminate lyase